MSWGEVPPRHPVGLGARWRSRGEPASNPTANLVGQKEEEFCLSIRPTHTPEPVMRTQNCLAAGKFTKRRGGPS